MKNKLLALIVNALFVFYATAAFGDSSIIDGKSIFTTRCTSCHNVNAQLVGPALANVDQRHTVDWIISFVHSSKILIQKNDNQAVALFNQFNQIVMPDHQDLSSDDIKSVLSYIKSETKNTASEAPFVKPWKIVPGYHPLSITEDAGFFISYLSAVFILVVLLIFAVNVQDMQRQKTKL